MFIQRCFSSLVNFYTSSDKRSNNIEIARDLEIPRETLSHAVVDKQSDGTLRWMTFNRFGANEYQVFKSEEHLDNYLSQNEMVDIWKIEDRREHEPKIIYNCCDVDDSCTFSALEKLYKEIATRTDYGVFCIYDIDSDEEHYIQQKRGWFHNSFEEISFEKAQQTFFTREAAGEQRYKSYALAIAILATASAAAGIEKILSKSFKELTNASLAPLEQTLQKTTTIFSAAFLTYRMGGLGRKKGQIPAAVLPTALMGVFSWIRYAEAQLLCPQLIGFRYMFPYPAIAVAVSGNNAYVADGRLQILDVSNVVIPTLVGLYDTPGRASGVTVSGNYAYVADDASGLQIIDVSNVANPTLAGFYDTPGKAKEVVVSGSYAYVADFDFGLQIIDVSNVANPTLTGWYDTPDSAWGIALSGNYAFVADYSSGLQIIDVSNVANPTLVGSYNTPGNAWDVAIVGNYAYVADGGSGLQIIDVANVANATLVGSYNTPGTAFKVAISSPYAYVADGGSGLQIIDVSNVFIPALAGSINTPGSAQGVTLSESYAYVADSDNFLIINVSAPCVFSSTISTTTSSSSSISTSSHLSDSSTQSSENFSRNSLPSQNSHIISSTLLSTSTFPSPWIGVGIGIAGLLCLGITGTTLFYYLKKEKTAANLDSSETPIFELRPVVKRGHKKIGEKYYQLSTISEEEAQEIYLQTGHLIVFPMEERKLKYIIGRGHFGAIKVAQRIEDGQYVVSKKVKGEEKMLESAAEANMQKEAAGANILPIYNTIKLEKALYHFMPLAGFGDGSTIQTHLAALDHSKLAAEVIKFVAKDLLTSLSTIHRKGIYHLDIKPDNLVFTKDGIGYITDFGCAKKSATTEQPSNAIGDNRYFSPERLQSRKDGSSFDGEKADIWAAGITLLQIAKNLDPHQLFAMPGQLALRIQRCGPEFFQEKLAYIKELQYPEEGSIWWVIKGLLDPNPATRFTAEEALKAPCLKWLNESLQAKVFEELAREAIAHKTKTNKEEVDLSNYRRIAQAALKEEIPTIYESEQQQQHYDLEDYGPMPTTSVREKESEMQVQLHHLEEGYSGMPTTQYDDYPAPPENPAVSTYF